MLYDNHIFDLKWDEEDDTIKSLIISFVVITVLNIIISKDSKYLKKNIGVIHFILGCFFILYLNIILKS